ncbi:kinase-like domain-containing protein [Xylariomycetidae sp. FL2044]|nr:kinase-like domain-containing protein [Xylariomycetidae sp. FL2044]
MDNNGLLGRTGRTARGILALLEPDWARTARERVTNVLTAEDIARSYNAPAAIPPANPIDTTDIALAYFTSERTKYVRQLGLGTWGRTLLFERTDDFGTRQQFAVKYFCQEKDFNTLQAPPYDPEDVMTVFQKERDMMTRLRGAEHIVQPVKGGLQIIEGLPYLIMEFAGNMTLQEFVNRAFKLRIQLSNRTLWSIFLCLIRACIALRFPRELDSPAVPVTRERIPPPDAPLPTSCIHHLDLSPSNVLVTHNFAPQEHIWAPQLKIIDFGCSVTVPPGPRDGAVFAEEWDANIYGIGLIMTMLLVPVPDEALVEREVELYLPEHGWDLLVTAADPDLDKLPYLDAELRTMILWCMQMTPEDHPSLGLLERVAMRRVAGSIADYGDLAVEYQQLETDQYVFDSLQRILNEADIIDPTIQDLPPDIRERVSQQATELIRRHGSMLLNYMVMTNQWS